MQQHLSSQARQHEALVEAERTLLELETQRRAAQEQVNQIRDEQQATQRSLAESQRTIDSVKSEVASADLAVQAAEQQLDEFESKHQSMIAEDMEAEDRQG